MNSRLVVVGAGICLLIPASIGLFSSGVPTLYCPLPTVTILPAFILSRWHLEAAAVIVPTLLFFLWNANLLANPRPHMPRRTFALLGLLTVLSIVDFRFGWKDGIHYQGVRYTEGICVLNLMWLAVLWWAIRHWRRHPSFNGNLSFNWLLFAWLAWHAFPYLGELP